MRSIIVLICLVFCPAVGNCEDRSFFLKLAETMRTAILTEDVTTIKSYIGPYGTDFTDIFFTRGQLVELLDDRSSWLTKHLFSAPDSVKRYFQEATDIEIRLQERKENFIMIVYYSPSRKFGEWKACCFFLRDGKWEFSGIFDCN